MLSLLAKLREITQFWAEKVNIFHEHVGKEVNHEDVISDFIKEQLNIGNEWESAIKINELDDSMTDYLSLFPDMPKENQVMFLSMNVEINQYTVRHIRRVNILQEMIKEGKITYRSLEMFLDRTLDYFLGVYDEITQSIRDINSDKSLAEILVKEKEEKEKKFGYFDYIMDVHKHAEDRIREYLDDRCFPAGSTTRKDILAILDDINAEINAEKDAEQ